MRLWGMTHYIYGLCILYVLLGPILSLLHSRGLCSKSLGSYDIALSIMANVAITSWLWPIYIWPERNHHRGDAYMVMAISGRGLLPPS